MTRTCLASVAVGVAVVLSSAGVQAHHGTNASYDPKKEMTLTGVVTKIYSAPVVSETKVHRLQMERAIDERMELFCVPSEEEAFNQAIRNPAGGVVK